MNKVIKRILIVVGALVAVMVMFVSFMLIKTNMALKDQVNEDIDMSKVADGRYEASSDGGLVQVTVAVSVQDHKITNIEILKHRNGKGEPAESITDDMIAKNTYDVDTVSGATVSSKTIKNAVNKALQKGLEK